MGNSLVVQWLGFCFPRFDHWTENYTLSSTGCTVEGKKKNLLVSNRILHFHSTKKTEKSSIYLSTSNFKSPLLRP